MRTRLHTTFAVVTAFLLLVAASHGQYVSNVSKVGATAANFLEIGVGARAIGMGGAYVSIAKDVNAIYWNPAGLSRLERGEVGFVHTEWIADINFDNISASFPMGNGMAVGAFVTTLGMEDMEVRTIERPEGTGEMFKAGDLAFGVAYSAMVTRKLSLGVTAKYIRQEIWHMTSSAMAVDMGLLFDTPFEGLTLGMALTNFGPKMMMEGRDTRIYYDPDPNNPGNNDRIPAHYEMEKWPLPLTFRVGLSSDVLTTPYGNLTASLDAVHPNNNYEYVNLGVEYGWRNWFYLRGGWKTLFLDDTEQGLTAGVGVRYGLTGNTALIADLAYADFGRLENVVRYSMGVQF